MKTATPICAVLAAALLFVVFVAPAAAQTAVAGSAALHLVDGTFERGEVVSLEAGKVVWRAAGPGAGERRIPLDQVLALSGAASRGPTAGVVVRLVGGDELRGEIVGGDAAGETLDLRSPVLGLRPVRIDRVESIAFLERVGDAESAAFAVPDDVDEDEALILPARRGFDLVVGFVHRFREDGIVFEARADEGPRLRSFATLAGFAFRGGEPRQAPAEALLTTVSGDRVGVAWRGLDEREFVFELEDGAVIRVRRGDLASLTPMVEGRTFLSDLPVAEARERSYFDDGDVPLLPYRFDRAVTGGPLRANGLGFGRGVGVHSRSALAWKVPEGARTLVGLVALDDSALELPVRGGVAVTVRQGDEVLLRIDELTVGSALRSLGALSVTPGKTLRLEVDFGPGLDLGDRVDWLGVAFLQ